MNFLTMPKYCVNLPKRTDRREHIEAEFKRFGLAVEFVDGIDGDLHGKGGNYGNMLAQLSIIEKATTEYVFICEDDICFCDDFLERMKYVESLNLDFDIFYIGGWYADKSKPVVKHIYEVRQMAGTHGFILRRTTFEHIKQSIRHHNGMDQYLSDCVLPNFKGMTFLPIMAGTIPSFSDIQKCNTDYNQSFKVFSKEAIDI